MKLTNQTILNAIGDNNRRPLRDGRGLELRISSNGQKSWSLLYWFHGKKYRYTIGPYPAVTLKHARKIVDGLRAQIANGANPQVEKKEAKAESDLTVAYCYQEFLERHLKAKLKSWYEYDRALRRDFLTKFGNKPVNAVTKTEVIKMLDDIGARGAPIHANRVLQYVKRFFGWCVEMDYVAASPVLTIPKPATEATRDRVLCLDEVRKIYDASDNLGKVHALFIKMMILTGHRRSELSRLKWCELTDDMIRLSFERSKNGKPIVTPLTDRMKKLLAQVPHGHGEFVFSTTNGNRPISGFSKMKSQLDMFCNVANWRLHDFRRSLATNLEDQNIDRFTVKCVLNHTDSSVTGVYDRSLHVGRKLTALLAWENQLFLTDNIILISQSRR